MLERVISGGQTGVDQAALYAAQDYGFQTGGWIPQGFRTLKGSQPMLGPRFGLREHSAYDYSPRTEQNVMDSDATIRIAEVFSSAGERCTLRNIKKHNKPHLDIQVMTNMFQTLVVANHNIERLLEFLRLNDIRTLNVAGNSESTAPGIYDATYTFLTKVFEELQNGK